jgi:hypothetical protein
MSVSIRQLLRGVADNRAALALSHIFNQFISEKADTKASPEIVLTPTRVLSADGTPASVATAGAATITAAQIMAGIYVRDCAGAGRTDTLDTAAALVAAIPGAAVGMVVSLLVINGSDAAETLTLAAGAGGAFDANQTATSRVIPQNASKTIRVRLTNVTPASEAYVVYA